MAADQNDFLYDSFRMHLKENINCRIKELKSEKSEEIIKHKADLAVIIGMSPSTLSHCLGSQGSRELTLWEFLRICVALKVPPETLAPITIAMSEAENNNPSLISSLELNTDKMAVSKTEKRLLLIFRSFSKDQQKRVFAIIKNLLAIAEKK